MRKLFYVVMMVAQLVFAGTLAPAPVLADEANPLIVLVKYTAPWCGACGLDHAMLEREGRLGGFYVAVGARSVPVRFQEVQSGSALEMSYIEHLEREGHDGPRMLPAYDLFVDGHWS